MDRLKTLSTFLAGVIVGGGAVYLSPAQPGAGDPGIPPMGTANPEFLPPPTEGGLPGQAPSPAPTPGLLPGSPPMGQPPAGVEPPKAPPPGTPGAASPPEGASTPPPEVPAPEVADTPAAPAAPGGNRLETHLREAPAAWQQVLTRTRAGGPAAAALAPEVQAHVDAIPSVKERMPPLQLVAAYLANSKVLVDRLAGAGVDVRDLKAQLDALLRPPQGDVAGERRRRVPAAR